MHQERNSRGGVPAGRGLGSAGIFSFRFPAVSPASPSIESQNPPATTRRNKAGALILSAFLAWCALQQTGCILVLVAVNVTPTSVSWGGVPVGTAGNPQTVTLTNNGTSAITISSIAISGANPGDFSVASKTCGTTLASGSRCTATLLFVPTVAGARAATFTFTHTGGMPTQTVSLSGTGTLPPSIVTVNPLALSFGNVNLGSTSGSQSVTLQNTGGSATSITSIGISGANAGDFAISAKTCGSTLAVSASCTVGVTFSPSANGIRTATLTFTDTAGSSPQTVALSGTGATSNASAVPASLSFAATAVGSTSLPQSVTLTNGGPFAIGVSSIAISGANAKDFAISAKTCGANLAVSASCMVSVTFAPSANGPRTATLTFTDSAGNSPQTVALSGTGANTGANVNPASLSFAAVALGSTSSPQSVTFSNTGSLSISVSTIAISGANAGDFAVSAKTCGANLSVSASCTVGVTFAPSANGTRTATLTFTDTAGNSPQTVALSGTGATSSASVMPASLLFTVATVGMTSSPQSVTLSNSGSVAINLTSIGISGANAADFTISSKTCGASLGVSASCMVGVAFTPSANGTRTATLTFTDSAGNSPQTVALSGTGGTSNASVMPTSLSLGSLALGATSAPQPVTLTDNGSVAINVNSEIISGPNSADFVISTNTCGGSLAGSANCTLTVVFAPTANGTRTATLTFTDSAGNSPQTVSLTGSAVGFSIQPMNPTVVVNQMLQFSATASANWTATCGTMNNTLTGLWTAPSSAQTCTVTATEITGTHAAASTQVTVTGSTSGNFALYPGSAAVVVGSQQVFQAQVANAPDTNPLSYSVDGVSGGNATSGTVTNQGVYTAPGVAGSHLMEVTDLTLGTTATAAITVYSNVTVDFGSRATNPNPVPAGLFGAQYLESLHNAADLDLVLAGGMTTGRTYAQITNVFKTSTPNWGAIDGTIRRVTANGGVHVMLEMYQSPTWLQQGTCGVESMPSDLNAWASIAQQYVAHMDATFPGIVTDYEIWNEPDIALCVPSGDSAMADYMKLYAAAVPLMRAQAKADGQTIRVGGPVSAGLNGTWITAMLNDPVISQNIDFMSYHLYLVGVPGLSAKWDTYNGTESIYQVTQGNLGPANVYEYGASLVAAGKQPQGKNLPIYITEYNLDWKFGKNCCSNDFTYSPVWNALYVADMLDVPLAYNGAPNSLARLIYYAATQRSSYCLIGEYDANMDCAYPAGSVPQPYPQLFTYQLLGSPKYLGLQNGAYMATSISPARLENGLVVTAFFTPSVDAVVLINPGQYTYTNLPVNITNSGLTSPQATLYQIVNGQSIQTSTLSLQPQGGTSYSTTVTLGPYSVQAISIHP